MLSVLGATSSTALDMQHLLPITLPPYPSCMLVGGSFHPQPHIHTPPTHTHTKPASLFFVYLGASQQSLVSSWGPRGNNLVMCLSTLITQRTQLPETPSLNFCSGLHKLAAHSFYHSFIHSESCNIVGTMPCTREAR